MAYKICYDLIGANVICRVMTHPEEQMKKLGFRIIEAIPCPIADSWLFTVENLVEPLEPYLKVIE